MKRENVYNVWRVTSRAKRYPHTDIADLLENRDLLLVGKPVHKKISDTDLVKAQPCRRPYLYVLEPFLFLRSSNMILVLVSYHHGHVDSIYITLWRHKYIKSRTARQIQLILSILIEILCRYNIEKLDVTKSSSKLLTFSGRHCRTKYALTTYFQALWFYSH